MLTLGIDLRSVGMEKIETLLDQTRAPTASGPHPLVTDWAWTILRHSERSEEPPSANAPSEEQIDAPIVRSDKFQLSLHRAGALPLIVEHPHLGVPLTTPLPIPIKGALTANDWQLQSTLLTPNDLPAGWRERGQAWRLFADAQQCDDLYLTTFQPGMSIAPLGMGGQRRALGDIFTDHKIPPFLRPGWPVVVNASGVVIWLCGLVVAEAVRVQPGSAQVRRLCWQPPETESIP
jgi:tRNA(Ile)-lysidine synthetase-like protein